MTHLGSWRLIPCLALTWINADERAERTCWEAGPLMQVKAPAAAGLNTAILTIQDSDHVYQ